LRQTEEELESVCEKRKIGVNNSELNKRISEQPEAGEL
jgi:hypothetical protein